MPGVEETRARARTELPPRWSYQAGDYVVAAEISADGAWCALGTGAGELIGLDLATGGERFRVRAHPAVLGVTIEPGSGRIASCGQDGKAALWSDRGERLAELAGSTAGRAWVEQVAWAPRGGTLATAAGRAVRLWSDSGQLLYEAAQAESAVTGLAWRRDGGELASSSYGEVRLLAAGGAAQRALRWKGSLISIAWSPDGKVLACGSQDCSVHFWRLPSGQDAQMSGYPFKAKALAWDRDSSLLATSGDAAVTLWDFRGKGPEGTRPLSLSAHRGLCTQLAFAPGKALLASGSADTSVLLWEPRRGERPVRFAFLQDEVTALAWHPQRQGLLGADASGGVAYWPLK